MATRYALKFTEVLSNLYPNSNLGKSKFEYGRVITYKWYEIPSNSGKVSDSIKLLSFGESDNKDFRQTKEYKSIKGKTYVFCQ